MAAEQVTSLDAFVTYVQAHDHERDQPALLTLFRKSAKQLKSGKPTADALLHAAGAVPAIQHPVGHGCILCAPDS